MKRTEGVTRTKIVLVNRRGRISTKKDVKHGLEIMDANNGEVWGKLDAGTETYFKLINRTAIRSERILQNLWETAKARPIILQSLFLRKCMIGLIPTAELAGLLRPLE